jgi:hypothetical protein
MPIVYSLNLEIWRKVAGVEPTGKRLTSPTGFEARPHHRMRMPSVRCFAVRGYTKSDSCQLLSARSTRPRGVRRV